MEKNASTNVLRIGDFVTFKSAKFGGTLCAEGILLQDLGVVESPKVFDDALFCVHLQRQYSASKELEEFLKKDKIDVRNITDANTAKYYQALKRGADNESRLNDAYLKKGMGRQVNFGDIIQLFHVKSGKYVKVIPDQLAKDERENIRIVLDTQGNSYSWIQVSPRYKIDRDGDRVLNTAEVLLKVAERSNEFIHRSDRTPLPGQDIEVNCSLEATSWKLNIFRSSVDSIDDKLLLSYELVYISDPETRCNLTLAPTTLESLDGDVISLEQTVNTEEDVEYFDNNNESGDDIPTRSPGFHEYGDAVLKASDAFVNSDFLWFIENATSSSGGPVKLKTDKVRFKHMNTSKYLKMDLIRVVQENGEPEERFVYSTTFDATDASVAFSLSEANNPGKHLQNAKALQIGANGMWLERGPLENGNYIVKPTEDKSMAVNLFINRFVEMHESDSINEESKEHKIIEPLDAYVGMSIRGYLHKYLIMTTLPKTSAVNTIWPSANRGDMPFFQSMVKKVVLFSQGFPISAENVSLGIDKGNSKLKIRRQSLLREQGTIEVVLRMINKLIRITERTDEIKNLPKRRAPLNENELTALEMGRIILSECFDVLYYSILDHSENQIYVADFLPVLLAHLSSQPMAGKCVTEMLSKNWELQETKISKREIKIFVDKLRSSKMNAMYLQLLQSCCSCEGNGVDGNQGKVADMLFEDTNDIIINLHADFNRSIKVPWTHSNLYIPTANVPGSPIRADSLINKGLPKLSLAWTTNSIDFSPLGLFGKLSVGIEELFGLKSELQVAAGDKASGAIAKKNKGKKNSLEQKRAVANYFIAEIFLGAEMCMDRNYISMHILDPMFPYEVLITLLKMDLSHEIKSAAVRLLMCLHIDRDPQAATKIPVLTRAWSDIEKSPEPKLPCVEAGRYYTFGLLQQLLSEHVQAMAGIPWDDLSRHMLRMLRTLVEFNFYGTNERMQDVIEPLITALDRRTIANESIVQRLSSKNAPSSITPSPSMEELDTLHATIGNGEGGVEGGDLENGGEGNHNSPSKSGALNSMMHSLTSTFSSHGNHKKNNDDNAEEDTADGNSSSQAVGAVKKYSVPTRYAKAPTYELETMVEMVDILAFAQKVIEDRNISLLMRYFFLWVSGVDQRTPTQLFEQVMEDSRALTMDVANFDDVMIDTLMFEHNDLVQSALELLMAHHSKRLTLLNNLYDLQLLASPGRERQFRIVDAMLKQLEQNAETQELWGELETDADRAINNQTIDILKELIDICQIRQSELDIDDENGDDDYRPDPAIQDLYRNLNCFEIAQKVLGLLDSVEEEEDGSISEAGENTKNMCRYCNELLYWFFLGNKKNQEMGYSDLDFFIETLDKDINSHRVIRAIFAGNEFLMRQVPHSYLNDLVGMIITNGKSHHYLTLLTSITHVGDKNIYENQLEICKTLTSPGPLQKVSCYFVPIDHPEYEEKRALMKPYLEKGQDVPLEELPPLLSYHLVFLEVLSGCTIGSKNMTTIEAKVQSVYNYEHILQSILDPGSITVCKIRLSKFFYNSVIEVDLKIPGLEQSPDVWKLLESYRSVLTQAFEQLEKVTKLGWDAPGVSKQKLQYIIVCIMIIGGFFEHYYQVAQFQPDDREGGANTTASSSSAATSTSPGKVGKVNFSMTHVDELVIFFFTKIKELYDYDSPKFADSTKKMMYKVLSTLNNRVSGENSIVNFIKPPHQLGTMKEKLANTNGEEDDNDFELAEDPEKDLLVKFKQFQGILKDDAEIQLKAANENVAFIRILESLPYIADSVIADVRYETLIKKLVFHIRENVKMVNNQKRMDARVTATSTWIIRAFRTMIENRMGMSIYERDEEGGEEQDINAAPVVNALNTCGGTALCLDLIADGIDEKLQLEAIKLGVGLLFKEGGALEVQGIMNTHLSQTNSELFFRQVRLTLQKLQAWHEWNGFEKQQESNEALEPPKEILIVRFLQLMCEGHYLPNQDIMREQPNNRVSYNILDDLVNYLNFLSSTTPCQIATQAAIRVSATILEVIQGPCVGNQTHFTLNTELVETLNRINRGRLENDCDANEEIELKKTAIDIFQGVLEGQGEHSVIYERVLSVIHLDIIQSMSNGSILQGVDGEEKGGDDEEGQEEKEILKTECVVLLQMLRNFKPSLAQELGISENLEDIVGSGTAMIEIVWRGEVQPRFFHIPQICGYLAKTSKDNLVENVDRTNPENKLVDFLNRAYELYLEVKHQEFLTKQNLSRVFSRENQNRATWITFYLAMAINVILLLTYTAERGDPKVDPMFATVIFILNILQAVVAGFVLILFLVVRIPVKYQSLQKQGYSEYETWLYTAMEPMTLYYLWYLAFSILGTVVSYDFLPFLLMDIVVKNSTTRDVLNAVIYPRKQIMMGGIVILIIVQIYTFFLFLYFRNELLPQGREFCSTFWGCYRTTLGYGLRSGGGIGDVFNVSVKDRWVLDITFYFAITVGMLNLIAGVIITTFGQLRENKARRVADTVGICFICGIDKQVFDRASDKPEGFTTHVKYDHNMWNYLYFIFLLWEQDKDDDDGLEQYVRRAIEANDIAWFPMNKAIRLRQAATKEESMIMNLTNRVKSAETNVSNRLERFNTDISIALEQLNQILKQDHAEGRSGESRAAKARVPFGNNKDVIAKFNQGYSNQEYVSATNPNAYTSRNMYIEILSVHEVRLPLAALDSSIQGMIVMDEVQHILPIDRISKTRVKFVPKHRIKLVENVQCDDERSCDFRLVYTDPLTNESRNLAVVKISIEELYLADETLLEIYLDPPQAHHRRKIVVTSFMEKVFSNNAN